MPRSKKGHEPWKPATTLDILNKKPGNRYRWCDSDPENLRRKVAEGWEFHNPITAGDSVDHTQSHISDGGQLDSSGKYRELQPMFLTEAKGKARDAYFRNLTEQQTTAPTEKLRKQADKAHGGKAPLHGQIQTITA